LPEGSVRGVRTQVEVVNVADRTESTTLNATDAGAGRYEVPLRPSRAGRFDVTVFFPDGTPAAAPQRFTAAMMSSTPDMYDVAVTSGDGGVSSAAAFAVQAGAALDVVIRSVTAVRDATHIRRSTWRVPIVDWSASMCCGVD